MPNSPHRIRRLRCLVSTNSQVDAFAIRKSLRDCWQDTLISAFESAFNEIAGGDGIIHIPKLEFHLKVTSEKELLEVLPELIQQQLNEQLQSMNLQKIPLTQPQITWRQTTATQNQFATLLHYLKTGSIPWTSVNASASEIAVNLQETCQQQREQLLNYLSEQPQTAAFYFRLLQLLPDSESFTLINTLLDGFLPVWRTAITELIKFVNNTRQNNLNRHTQLQIVAAIISECLSQRKQQQKPNLSSILDRLLFPAGIEHNTFIDLVPATAAILFVPQQSLATSSPNPPTLENQQIIPTANETIIQPHNPESIRLFDNKDISNQTDELVGEIASTNEEFPLFVNYAGLVLIHPFISSFFEATGVKETNSKALADAQLPRAAALLHFLATEQTKLYEYELGLIKILLGLKPDTPLLVGEGLIQDSEREEAEAVLQSIINHWSVIKNTSIEGLRSSFVQRSGLLRQTENGWSLQIEHQSFDMLLKHLPWSISIIKLSWMKQPLNTEWQTF